MNNHAKILKSLLKCIISMHNCILCIISMHNKVHPHSQLLSVEHPRFPDSNGKRIGVMVMPEVSTKGCKRLCPCSQFWCHANNLGTSDPV